MSIPTSSPARPLHRPHRPRARRRLATVIATATIGTAVGPLLGPTTPAAAAPPIVAVTGRATLTEHHGNGATGVDRQVLTDRTGRLVFFSTPAALVATDTNGTWDVYRRDQRTSQVERVSLTDADSQIGGASHLCGLSPEGDAFGFYASGAGLPSAPGVQLYVRLADGTTRRASEDTDANPSGSGGTSGLDVAQPCGVSSHGERVVFASTASNLVSGDVNIVSDVFVFDRLHSFTDLVSRASGQGAQGNGPSSWPSISDDGSKVAFQSTATNLVGGDTNAVSDVFVRNTETTITVRASDKPSNIQVAGASTRPGIGGDGHAVAYESNATDLVADDTNGTRDIFVTDLDLGAVERVSVASNGAEATGSSSYPTMSSGSRFVGFSSVAANLHPFDGNGLGDAFRHDRVLDRTDLVSRTNAVAPGSGASEGGASISDDGNLAAFSSTAEDLVRMDGNGTSDAFTRTYSLDYAPFGSLDGYLTQVYEDFAGSVPAGAIDVARPMVQNGEVGIDQLLVSASRSNEFAHRRAPMVRLYWAFFRRQPDLGGLDYWIKRLDQGKKLSTAATQFSTSSEFQSTYGSLANDAFVGLIYENIFDRAPDAGGLAYWTKKLGLKQKTRGEVMLAFSESSEGLRLLQDQVDAALIPLGMLHALPSDATFQTSWTALRAGAEAEDLASYVRHSGEYALLVAS